MTIDTEDFQVDDVTEDEFQRITHILTSQVMSYVMDGYDLSAKLQEEPQLRFLARLSEGTICSTSIPIPPYMEGERLSEILQSSNIQYGMIFCRWKNDSMTGIGVEPPDDIKNFLVQPSNGRYTPYIRWDSIFGESHNTRRITDEQIDQINERYEALIRIRAL